MYEVFDNFLAVDTWHTTHPLDQERFDKALVKIINSSNFNPSDMGDYFYDRVDQNNSNYTDAIQRYVDRAESVKDFLDNTR